MAAISFSLPICLSPPGLFIYLSFFLSLIALPPCLLCKRYDSLREEEGGGGGGGRRSRSALLKDTQVTRLRLLATCCTFKGQKRSTSKKGKQCASERVKTRKRERGRERESSQNKTRKLSKTQDLPLNSSPSLPALPPSHHNITC